MIKLKNLIKEETITPGSKEYYKPSLTDDGVLKLAKVLGDYPHTKLKGGPAQQVFFKDIANILGYPTIPVNILTYSDGVGYPDKAKMKMNPKKSRLFQMYKSGKLTMNEYGEIQKSLMRRYIQVAKSFSASLTWRKI